MLVIYSQSQNKIYSLLKSIIYLLQIETQKLDFKDKAESKIGSKDNMEHKPLGGDIKVSSFA
jgi:hypothetical protein